MTFTTTRWPPGRAHQDDRGSDFDLPLRRGRDTWSRSRCPRATRNVAGRSVDRRLSAAAMHWILACFLFQSYPPLPLPGRRRRRLLPHVPRGTSGGSGQRCKVQSGARHCGSRSQGCQAGGQLEGPQSTSGPGHLFSGLGQSQIAEQHQPQWLRNPWSIERRPPHPPCAHCGEVDAWEL